MFESILEYLNSIPNINRGGCGISAYVMYKYLKKNKLIDDSNFKFVFLYETMYKYRSMSTLLINRSKVKFYQTHVPAHLIIRYNNVYYDSTGEFDMKNNRYCTEGVLEVEPRDVWIVERCLKNYDDWNSSFERNRAIDRIKRDLRIKLNRFKIPQAA